MHLLTAGDSWTFGSEIRDPDLPDSVSDWDPKNNAYRIPRVWPTKLAEMLHVNDYTNIAYPAASNDRIVRHTLAWITENYMHVGKDPSDLFVIVGFTSPERKDFYYRDPVNVNRHGWTTIWPNQSCHDYGQPGMNEFFDLYKKFLWNKEEYTNRYVQQVLQLENFFKAHKIKYMFFQAFYNIDEVGPTQWVDYSYVNSETDKMQVGENDPRMHWHYGNQVDGWLWDQVDPIRFYGKTTEPHTFFGYIKDKDSSEHLTNVIVGMHPNEYGHELWAEELYRYIEENNLW